MTASPKLEAIRAATYSRYSSDQQRASSIVDQQRNCHKRAEAEGWSVLAEFADAAISGSDNRRPQYLAMQQAAARKEFDILIVDDLSRLTRDSVEQETTLRRLEFQGIRIIATSDGYDSQSKSRKIQRGFKGLMNEMFLDDLRAKVHRGLEGQALKRFWCGGKPYGYRLKAITDASRLDAYGEPVRIGTMLILDPVQSKIVAEIFERYCAGETTVAIASDLNRRGVPSAGSTWNRKTHRASGWMYSSVRVIIKNPLYTGQQRWNATQFVRDPDTHKYLRRHRPKSEWVTHQIEELRIVSDEVFQRAQARGHSVSDNDPRLKSGGKSKYLLSGLLRCETCGAHYIVADKFKYACSTFLGGGNCKNGVYVRRDALEDVILGPIRTGLRDPAVVAKMAADMEAEFARKMQAKMARNAEAPRELQELDARLARLRARQQAGDPDMTADELQGLIDGVERKRVQLKASLPEQKQQARILALLPMAAKTYLKQIDEGLGGNIRQAAKGRFILREMLGPIVLSPGEDGSLWAIHRKFEEMPWALVKQATGTAGTHGRGEGVCSVPAGVRVRVKAGRGVK